MSNKNNEMISSLPQNIQKYKIEGKLGTGSYGVVYKVLNKGINI
jgi:hypothetical protein